MATEKITVTSFSKYGEERVRTVPVPSTYRCQQSVKLDGWEITLFEDGSLHVERSSVEHSDLALRPTLHSVNGHTWSITVEPYVPSFES